MSQVVTETMEPWIERGLFAYQVVVDETLSARTGPHDNAPGILQQLPPYSVAAAVRKRVCSDVKGLRCMKGVVVVGFGIPPCTYVLLM